jgi:hypothetical protein
MRLQTLPFGIGKIGCVAPFHAQERTSPSYRSDLSNSFGRCILRSWTSALRSSPKFESLGFCELRLSEVRGPKGVRGIRREARVSGSPRPPLCPLRTLSDHGLIKTTMASTSTRM